jgi:hypothetical protein
VSLAVGNMPRTCIAKTHRGLYGLLYYTSAPLWPSLSYTIPSAGLGVPRPIAGGSKILADRWGRNEQP